MRLAVAVVALALLGATPAGPRVIKGPIITGVHQDRAWVAWETREPEGGGGPVATVRISPPAGGHFAFTDPSHGTVHHVLLTGLRPGTRYDLDVDDVPGTFTSAPATRTSFKFIVYGDNRDAPPSDTPTRAAHEALMAAMQRFDADASFLVQTGDLALNMKESATPERGWPEFFDVEQDFLSSHPLFAVVGNHETIDMDEFDALIDPRSFEGSPHPYWWSFDWGGLHFAMVDAFEGPIRRPERGDRSAGISPEQAKWLALDLEAATKHGQRSFIVSHQSPFSHVAPGARGHGSSSAVASVLVPLMWKYHALGVLAGHDHFYEHGTEDCIDYFVVGGGGAPMYDPDPNAPGVKAARKATSYLVITVAGEKVSAVARTADGQVIETCDLKPADPAPCEAAARHPSP